MAMAKKQPTTKKAARSTSPNYQPTKADTLGMLEATLKIMRDSGHDIGFQEIGAIDTRPAGVILFIPHAKILEGKIIIRDFAETVRVAQGD